MEKRFVDCKVWFKGDYVMMPCEVIAEGQKWIVTKRPFFDEGEQAVRYFVEYNGKRDCNAFTNPIEAILHAIGRVYGDEHRGKNLSQFHAFAYAMLEGMPSYE